jgi:hypothetical protein
VKAWGEPTFRVRNKLFAMYADAGNHHGNGRSAVWCKSTHVTQDLLVRMRPEQRGIRGSTVFLVKARQRHPARRRDVGGWRIVSNSRRIKIDGIHRRRS